MSIKVNNFVQEKGINDLEYIELLKNTLANNKMIINKAVAKIKELSKENEELKNTLDRLKNV